MAGGGVSTRVLTRKCLISQGFRRPLPIITPSVNFFGVQIGGSGRRNGDGYSSSSGGL
jgi:hypothetical protein